MQVKCQCGKVLTVPDSFAGKKARCPTCRNVFQVPGKAQPIGNEAVPKDRIVKTPDFSDMFEDGDASDTPASKPDASAKPEPKPAKKPDMGSFGKGPAPIDETFTLAQAKCNACGASLPAGAQLCVECGTNLGTGTKVAMAEVNTATSGKVDKKKNVIVIAAAIAATVIVVGVTLIVFF